MNAQFFNAACLPADDGKTQQLLMRLEIYDESIFRAEYQDGERVSYVEISPLDLAGVFAGVGGTATLLPQNALFYHRQGGSCRLGLYLPPAARLLKIDGEDALTVPLPPLVFCGQGGKSYAIYALGSNDWPASDSPLYQAPFPNVHSDGNICPGNVAFPQCSPETITGAAALFFESDFNRDLGNGKSRAHPGNVINQWQKLAGGRAKQYPLDDLQPAQKTVGELLNV